MATLIQAIATYRPRIAHSRLTDLDELTDHLAVGTLVTAPLAQMVLRELGRQALLQSRSAVTLRLPGIGLIGNDIRLDGTPFPQIRVDKALRVGLADAEAIHGEITNQEMIGVALEAYKDRWDREHPGDPVVMPERGGVVTDALAQLRARPSEDVCLGALISGSAHGNLHTGSRRNDNRVGD